MPVRGMDGRKSPSHLRVVAQGSQSGRNDRSGREWNCYFYHMKGSDLLSKLYLCAAEIGEIMDCSESYAYRIIKELNSELKAEGYIIRPGRIPKQYFYERTGLDMERAEEART